MKKDKETVLKWHSYYKGKIEIGLKAPVRGYDDFAIWYTPGVAEPCREIKKRREEVFEYTNKANFVAIVSDGTRVLGLGNVGPEAGLPVMEGKAMLFKYLGGVDAFPLCLNTTNGEEIIKAVKWVAPTFGGVNLEDIEKPKCYYIHERLEKELNIPVWHDDQQGTALVVLAALINALKVVGKKMGEAKIAMVGAGAANINVAKYICLAGVRYGHIIMVDRGGILNAGREDVVNEKEKREICEKTNEEGKEGGIREAMKDSDVCVAFSASGPGVIKKRWVVDMADDAVVFAGANPVPEIWPWEAEEGGARIVATGRSDFKNQINNALGFPAVFRGVLEVRARHITEGMCIEAAKAIARYAEEKGINPSYIIPRMNEGEMYIREAVAVGMKAIDEGVAMKEMSRGELEERTRNKIEGVRNTMECLIKEKIICLI